ncbi:MAG TPA: hypothetical protein VFI46_07355 [Jiangellaceae bacterium]|nr:hypothetical protein [Jiangellaceae bacterium]
MTERSLGPNPSAAGTISTIVIAPLIPSGVGWVPVSADGES